MDFLTFQLENMLNFCLDFTECQPLYACKSHAYT